MAIKVAVEQHGAIIAEITTGREDIAAQLVYEAVKTAMQEDCGCGDVCLDEMMGDIINSFESGAKDLDDYLDPSDGYTTSESAERAMEKVTDILRREADVSEEEMFNIVLPAAHAAIVEGIPRDHLYKLAGQVAREFRDFGYYVGVPLAEGFKYKVQKELKNV